MCIVFNLHFTISFADPEQTTVDTSSAPQVSAGPLGAQSWPLAVRYTGSFVGMSVLMLTLHSVSNKSNKIAL
jgi:hypothetical protein